MNDWLGTLDCGGHYTNFRLFHIDQFGNEKKDKSGLFEKDLDANENIVL